MFNLDIILFLTTIFCYYVAASVDLGSWVLVLLAKRSAVGDAMQATVDTYSSPFWEIINVFLVFIVVDMVALFPSSIAILGTALLWPLGLAVLFLVLRGTALFFGHVTQKNFFLPIHAVAGSLTVLALASILLVSQGGFLDTHLSVRFGNFLSPMAIAFFGLVVSASLYLAAHFLFWQLRTHQDQSVQKAVAQYLRVFAALMVIFGAMWFAYLPSTSLWLAAGLAHAYNLLFVGAFFFLMSVLTHRGRKRKHWGFFYAVIGYVFFAAAYFEAHAAYLLFPLVSVAKVRIHGTLLTDLTIASVIGLAILLPSLMILVRVFSLRERREIL